ncbi:hypothetical protein X942_5951 [Burkholderia pseudomallei MSHR5596]|nr:hypothetical protein X942_5951 [Burkholderia pseudomallei MSHR5596]
MPAPLLDLQCRATCRERTVFAATANGHRSVFPHAEMIVTNWWATFTRELQRSLHRCPL